MPMLPVTLTPTTYLMLGRERDARDVGSSACGEHLCEHTRGACVHREREAGINSRGVYSSAGTSRAASSAEGDEATGQGISRNHARGAAGHRKAREDASDAADMESSSCVARPLGCLVASNEC